MELRTQALLIRRYAYLLRRSGNRSPDFAPVRRRFYRDYWRHAAGLVGAEISPLGEERYRISLGKRATHVQYHYVNLDTYFNKRLADEKAWMGRQIASHGFRIPAFVEYDLLSLPTAETYLDRSERPCVVKPVSGSGGQGVTTSIDRHRRLVEASLFASDAREIPKLMLEEQVSGESFRLLYLDGCLLHAVKRGRCSVVGDGKSPLRALMEQENKQRLRAQPVASLDALSFDLDAKYKLADQGLRFDFVPRAGEQVFVKNVANQNAKRDQSRVTEFVHADYHELARLLFEQFGFRLVGLDVMATDIAAPPGSNGSAVNEVNIPPGLHYHEITESQSSFTEVGAEILACLLRECRPGA